MNEKTKIIQLNTIEDLIKKDSEWTREQYTFYMNSIAPMVKTGDSTNIKKQLLADYTFMEHITEFKAELLNFEKIYPNVRIEFVMDFESPILEDLTLLLHSTTQSKFVNGIIKIFKLGTAEEIVIFNFTFDSGYCICDYERNILDKVKIELLENRTLLN